MEKKNIDLFKRENFTWTQNQQLSPHIIFICWFEKFQILCYSCGTNGLLYIVPPKTESTRQFHYAFIITLFSYLWLPLLRLDAAR
jgi:hypothetical protein